MLTLFVVVSGKPNANYDKTVESFNKSGVEFTAHLISSWREINSFEEKGDWFCVFWDNEGLDVNLQKALPAHLANKVPDVLVLYKKLDDANAEYRTRFMRRGVWLSEDYKPVSPWVIHETVLDGWVKEHAINDKH
jgi:hypothetical protein